MKISHRDACLEDLEWLESFYKSAMRPSVEITLDNCYMMERLIVGATSPLGE